MHQDLLLQAHELARIDPKKPKQVNLRRAVSSAYYALFHFLCDQHAKQVMGTMHDAQPYRNVLARAFHHAAMKEACGSFGGGKLKHSVAKGLPASFAIPRAIGDLAQTFVDLQQMRHSADYDRSEVFARQDVVSNILLVETAIAKYEQLDDPLAKKFFLACLLSWKALASR